MSISHKNLDILTSYWEENLKGGDCQFANSVSSFVLFLKMSNIENYRDLSDGQINKILTILEQK